MEENKTPSKIDLRYSEKKVIFSICDCSVDKKYSFYQGMDRTQAECFLKRLKHIENLTWSQFSALPRTNGLTVERSGTESFGMIHEQNTSAGKITEQYYYHFRVEQTGTFRVFGYQRGQFFCITHIDVSGRIHDH
jgi:hypothetical protein